MTKPITASRIGIYQKELPMYKYRLLIVQECLFYSGNGVSHVINPFGKCKTLEPIAMASGMLLNDLSIKMSKLDIAVYFGLSNHEIDKILSKHTQWMAINPRYKGKYEKCLVSCERVMRCLTI